jgi:hypothetical protein
MENHLQSLLDCANKRLRYYSIQTLSIDTEHVVIYDSAETLYRMYYSEIKLKQPEAMLTLESLVCIQDFLIFKFNAGHLENISKANMLVLFINTFPEHEASRVYFGDLSSWFIENEGNLELWVTRSKEIRAVMKRRNKQEWNSEVSQEANNLLKIKQRIAVLKKVETHFNRFDPANSHILLRWIKAFPDLI